MRQNYFLSQTRSFARYKASYLDARFLAKIYECKVVEVVYFTFSEGAVKPFKTEVFTSTAEDEEFWSEESQKCFKIIGLEHFDPLFHVYELRDLAEQLGYKLLLKEEEYFGYYYRVSQVPAAGCAHVISGCQYLCKHCEQYYFCKTCAGHEIEKCNTIKCVFCQHSQPFNYECIYCKQFFGNYYCKICEINIHQTDFIHPFSHCEFCNCCHPDNYEYCQACCECFEKNYHFCKGDRMCPICLNLLEADRIFGGCGHEVCYKCYRLKIGQLDVKCPICRKTLLLEQDRYRLKETLEEDNCNYDCDDIVLKCKCNDCNSEFMELAERWQYCKQCDFFNVDVLESYQNEDYNPDSLFEPTIHGMKEFLLTNYKESVKVKFGLKIQNDEELISRIYDYLGITADNKTALKLSKTVRFGMSLDEMKIRIKLSKKGE